MVAAAAPLCMRVLIRSYSSAHSETLAAEVGAAISAKPGTKRNIYKRKNLHFNCC